jgi:hypothetical protein
VNTVMFCIASSIAMPFSTELEGRPTRIDVAFASLPDRRRCGAMPTLSATHSNSLQKLRGDRLLGRFFAASRAKLRDIAERLGVRHLVELRGCPVR